MAQVTRRFAIDRKGSTAIFVRDRSVTRKETAKELADRLRRRGEQVRVTKAKRQGRIKYDIWVR